MDQQARGLATAHEHAVMLRVEGHREIRTGGRERPRGGYGAALPVDHRDVARARHVHEYPHPPGLERECLRMPFQLDLPDLTAVGRPENGESSTPGTDIQQ